jgi:hypothetical protein
MNVHMARHPDQQPAVRRVVLPSGKTIEVVYFADLETAAARRQESAGSTAPVKDDLHVCPDCTSQLVFPTSWEEAGEEAWALFLRCPNCEWAGEGVYAQDAVERLDEELDRGTQALVRDLKGLIKANMEEEIERFVGALDAGHILPEDF